MKDHEIKDNILTYLCDKEGIFTPQDISQALFNDSQVDRVESLLKEMVGDNHVHRFDPPAMKNYGAKPEGCSFLNDKGGYTKLDKDMNKELGRSNWDRTLDRIAKVCAILFGLATIILSILLANCQ